MHGDAEWCKSAQPDEDLNTKEHPIFGKRKETFDSPYTSVASLDRDFHDADKLKRKKFVILKELLYPSDFKEEADAWDEESLPAYFIRFDDGLTVEAYPEEIFEKAMGNDLDINSLPDKYKTFMQKRREESTGTLVGFANFGVSHFVIADIKIDAKTGEVTFPEGMQLSDVSRQIWEGIKKVVK